MKSLCSGRDKCAVCFGLSGCFLCGRVVQCFGEIESTWTRISIPKGRLEASPFIVEREKIAGADGQTNLADRQTDRQTDRHSHDPMWHVQCNVQSTQKSILFL